MAPNSFFYVVQIALLVHNHPTHDLSPRNIPGTSILVGYFKLIQLLKIIYYKIFFISISYLWPSGTITIFDKNTA